MKKMLLSTAVLLTVVLPAVAVDLPQTVAGRLMSSWLTTLVHPADDDRVRAFVTTQLSDRIQSMGSIEDRMSMLRRTAEDLAGVEPLVVEVDRELEIVVVCRTRSDEYVRLSLRAEADPPHRIDGLRVEETDSPENAPVVAADDDALVEATRAYVDSIAGEGRFSGTALIAHDGHVIFEGAWGLAHRRCGVPNDVDTRFNLGSMNKMFTAVAVAQLVEAGRIGWDDVVGTHLPDYPNPQVRDSVTVRHLLTHTSGMGTHFTEEFLLASKLEYREPADYLPLFVDEPLAFSPGTRFSYSNAGFFVLGMIIEAVSAETYFDYIREHVYRPAGMLATDSYESDGTDPNLAVGYYEDEGHLRENTLLHSVKGTPAGGGYSTVGDLARFANALVGGRLVSSETLDLMTAWTSDRGARAGIARGYGYGFTLRRTADGLLSFGHAGGFPGINGVLDIYPDAGYTVATLANMDGGAEKVAARIRGTLPRE